MENTTNQLPKVTLDDINKMNKESIKIKPKDEISEGVIINMEIKTWSEHLKDNPERLAAFNEPDKEMLFITYESQGFKGVDTYTPMAVPTENSALGRFILKYDLAPTIGAKVKVKFDGKGYTKILIE